MGKEAVRLLSGFGAYTMRLTTTFVLMVVFTTMGFGASFAEVTDYSNDPTAPTNLGTLDGFNTISGTVGGVDSADWFTFEAPVGWNLLKIQLTSYAPPAGTFFTPPRIQTLGGWFHRASATLLKYWSGRIFWR